MMGPGFGGRVGASKGSLLTQYLMKQGAMVKETWMDEDPREAILKYADVAAKEPKYIAPAYAQTQPETVFAKSGSEDEKRSHLVRWQVPSPMSGRSRVRDLGAASS
ncbi:hypothetical protein ACFX16_035819 [Malus domestica]